ncbi:MAG: hypothetical protein ACYS47_10695 [Planctomycetota bacterium]|jgi:hypothetical protein
MTESADRYNTRELLSVNMDRLKKYMSQLGAAVADTDAPQVFEAPPVDSQSATRIAKVPTACTVLAMYDDPLEYVRLAQVNDDRHPTYRYHLERASDFSDLAARMSRRTFDLVILSPASWPFDDEGNRFTSLDLLFLVKGLMRPSDMYFLAKKRWFVIRHVHGEDNHKKVENFRALKAAYAKVPVVFHHDALDPRDREVLASTSKLRLLPFGGGDPEPILALLDSLTETTRE